MTRFKSKRITRENVFHPTRMLKNQAMIRRACLKPVFKNYRHPQFKVWEELQELYGWSKSHYLWEKMAL